MERTRTSYQRAPEVPATLQRRWDAVVATLAGRTTVTEGAKALGMARVNFQTLVHRAEAALLASLEPRPSGRTPKPPELKTLETEVRRLRAQVAKLEKQRDTMDELLGVAGDVIRELRGMPPLQWRTTSPRSTRSSPQPAGSDPEDPEPPGPSAPGMAPTGTTATGTSKTTEDPEATGLFGKVATMSDRRRAAIAIGVGPSTLRRWRARRKRGEPARRPRGGRSTVVAPEAATQVRGLVRELHGMVGAGSLAHSVVGVSRRQAALLKADELRAMERERRAASGVVEVMVPGVIRGFDAVHVLIAVGRRFILIAADASIPFRTSAPVVPSYTSNEVAQALEDDFERHGAPLVCRLDRASCQQTIEVMSVFERWRVLALHGPPHHPCYYGQLERQNREHRAWLEHAALDSDEELRRETGHMLDVLNRRWRRRTLDWCTSASLWDARPPLTEDRAALREEVEDRAAHLRAKNVEDTMATRLAIEQALIKRGYLRVQSGRRSAM